MFSIIIPTYNNLDYLKLTIASIKKFTKVRYEILIHVNEGNDGTLQYVKKNKFIYTHSKQNLGLCSSINLITKKAKYNYYLYSHDDMFFCPDWDKAAVNEINKIKHNKFYISGTMIEPNSGHIKFNAGYDIKTFNKNKLINNLSKLKFYDHQGTHFAPHIVHKSMWNRVGGFSEEFNPGFGSDPDFNMKLWKQGVRIFKGINNFRVYHFGSITTRKNKMITKNRGDKTFLKKWGITVKFFKKHYLKSGSIYNGPLNDPHKNINYFLELLISKIKLLFLFV